MKIVVIPPKDKLDYLAETIVEGLYKNNVEVIPMRLRHARTLGGSFHCVTLDTYRKD